MSYFHAMVPSSLSHSSVCDTHLLSLAQCYSTEALGFRMLFPYISMQTKSVITL